MLLHVREEQLREQRRELAPAFHGQPRRRRTVVCMRRPPVALPSVREMVADLDPAQRAALLN